ncbi:family 1 glycosylhydrolase [Noviherbaspirillum galbum]|uniref:dTDP-4-dehydrorhamnose reductase n=1 Tax=Noviherbaspirillum galbum TaxID=2709383 RepID=A0A6B3SPH1_9BURK|nr:family 1 glycosylhydrolase [Noviherbaspirillum galbum]NEX60302.1 sugar nucleotide-binding protein [Noviherbaspirillum galbum]
MTTSQTHQAQANPKPPLELWGGIECTVVRLRNEYRDQVAETGHQDRIEDLDAIAEMGIKTLRYPVLWETISPDDPETCDWRWHDARLQRLRELGINPIAGLVHHGSGPRYTDLLDPEFPEKLARHAENVARRYPWLEMFTPVNEPLTTARFSGLYGHWYPHGRDTATMLRALFNECRGVKLAMAAIRRVIPGARLVQTDDMGKAFSIPDLQHEADYQNERRWLAFDLLVGRVGPQHGWYQSFLDAGVPETALQDLADEPCPPDIVGINHYLTSERFLDSDMDRYPSGFRCDDHPHYVDVQAVRVPLANGVTGPEARLREVWERYRLPIVVTEAHHGGARDDQLRWLTQIWQASLKLREEGADIRAVTIWSMFGCVDWNTLLLCKDGFYESGAFDARCTPPRLTALGKAAASLAKTGSFDHPVLDGIGWWQREDRYFFTPEPHHAASSAPSSPAIISHPRKLVITGATGTLGQAMSRICHFRGLAHDVLSRKDMDIADESSVEAALARHRPWAVINTAGYVRVAEASREQERCFRENAHGAEVLARACAHLGIPYITFSSDLVFDGSLGRAYVESDEPSPSCVYGSSKADAERRVMMAHPEALVVRTSAFFGPWDRYNFVHNVLRDLASGVKVEVRDDVLVSPTYVPDLAHCSLDLLMDHETGIWHLANQGLVSWYELAERAAHRAGMDTAALVKTHGGGRGITALSSERGLILPSLASALDRYMHENTMAWNADKRAAA